jgi:hypothetical protein
LLTESCTANCRLVMRRSAWIMLSASCNMSGRWIMQLRFSTSCSLNSLNPGYNGASIDSTTSIYSTHPFVNVPHIFFPCH